MRRIVILLSTLGSTFHFSQDYGRVGINTSLPQATLDVNISASYPAKGKAGIAFPTLTGDQIESMDTSNLRPGTLIYASAASTATTKDVNAVGFWYWTGDAIKKWESFLRAGDIPIGTEPWYNANGNVPATANNQNIYQMGNVGIGTTEPVAPLHIVSNTGTLGGLANDIVFENYQTISQWPGVLQKYGRGTKASPENLVVGDEMGGIEVQGYTDNVFKILGRLRGKYMGTNLFKWDITSTGGNITLDEYGKTGIGTTEPVAPLHIVSNTGALGGLANDIVFENYQTISQWPAVLQKYGRGTKTSPENLVAGDEIGGIEIQGYTDNVFKILGRLRGRYMGTNLFKWDITSTGGNITLDEYGKTGIGVLEPNYKLEVAGTVAGTSWTNTSDQRFKENIMPINYGISTVNQLKPVTYDWNTQGKERGGDNKNHMGFIAQDLEKVLPSIVNTAPDSYKTVNYMELIPVLTKAIQEQQKQIEFLMKKIETLEKMKAL